MPSRITVQEKGLCVGIFNDRISLLFWNSKMFLYIIFWAPWVVLVISTSAHVFWLNPYLSNMHCRKSFTARNFLFVTEYFRSEQPYLSFVSGYLLWLVNLSFWLRLQSVTMHPLSTKTTRSNNNNHFWKERWQKVIQSSRINSNLFLFLLILSNCAVLFYLWRWERKQADFNYAGFAVYIWADSGRHRNRSEGVWTHPLWPQDVYFSKPCINGDVEFNTIKLLSCPGENPWDDIFRIGFNTSGKLTDLLFPHYQETKEKVTKPSPWNSLAPLQIILLNPWIADLLVFFFFKEKVANPTPWNSLAPLQNILLNTQDIALGHCDIKL